MENLRTSLTNIRSTFERDIKRVTPVRTGNLRNSVSAIINLRDQSIEVETLDYGKYVNARTGFLTNAVSDSELSEMGDDIAKGSADDLEKELQNIFK